MEFLSNSWLFWLILAGVLAVSPFAAAFLAVSVATSKKPEQETPKTKEDEKEQEGPSLFKVFAGAWLAVAFLELMASASFILFVIGVIAALTK